MEFYKKVEEMINALKQTEEYVKYMELKQIIKQDEMKSNLLQEFKEKQKVIQMEYIKNNGVLDENKKANMEKLFNIIVQDENIKLFLDYEIKLDMLLANMQKMIGEGIEDINNF